MARHLTLNALLEFMLSISGKTLVLNSLMLPGAITTIK